MKQLAKFRKNRSITSLKWDTKIGRSDQTLPQYTPLKAVHGRTKNSNLPFEVVEMPPMLEWTVGSTGMGSLKTSRGRRPVVWGGGGGPTARILSG